ncbi:unnamed protein product [Camellia sinensis]
MQNNFRKEEGNTKRGRKREKREEEKAKEREERRRGNREERAITAPSSAPSSTDLCVYT